MTEVKREALADFLRQHIKHESAVSAHMALVEPFFLYAERGEYGFVPKRKLEADESELKALAHRIGTAIDEPVENILLVSHSELLRPAWSKKLNDPKDYYEERLGYIREMTLRSIGENIKHSNHWVGAKVRYESDTDGEVRRKLTYAIIENGLYHTHFGINLGNIQHKADLAVVAPVRMYLGFAAAGDLEMVNRLRPYVHILAKVIPLGYRHGTRDFIVLCG